MKTIEDWVQEGRDYNDRRVAELRAKAPRTVAEQSELESRLQAQCHDRGGLEYGRREPAE